MIRIIDLMLLYWWLILLLVWGSWKSRLGIGMLRLKWMRKILRKRNRILSIRHCKLKSYKLIFKHWFLNLMLLKIIKIIILLWSNSLILILKNILKIKILICKIIIIIFTPIIKIAILKTIIFFTIIITIIMITITLLLIIIIVIVIKI